MYIFVRILFFEGIKQGLKAIVQKFLLNSITTTTCATCGKTYNSFIIIREIPAFSGFYTQMIFEFVGFVNVTKLCVD